MVVFVDNQRIKIALREQGEQLGNASLDQMDRRRFKRLQEATGEANGDDILFPQLVASASREAQLVRSGQSFAIVDIETTGLDIEADRIVQIAVVQIDAGEIAEQWTSLVNPGAPIPAAASEIHGITDERVADAPAFAAVAGEIARLCQGRTLCGYNAAHFDVPFIRQELLRAGRRVGHRVPVYPMVWLKHCERNDYVRGKGRHKLAVACERWGVVFDGPQHDALADCRATWRLFRALVEDRADEFPADFDDLIGDQVAIAREQEREFKAWLTEKEARRGDRATDD
jgi:DNA polymerase III epsilon subunit family exonuclease